MVFAVSTRERRGFNGLSIGLVVFWGAIRRVFYGRNRVFGVTCVDCAFINVGVTTKRKGYGDLGAVATWVGNAQVIATHGYAFYLTFCTTICYNVVGLFVMRDNSIRGEGDEAFAWAAGQFVT